MDAAVVGDVVPVVLQRRRVERQQPDRRHSEVGDVVELLEQSTEVAVAIAVRITKGFDVELIDDGVVVPGRIRRQWWPSYQKWFVSQCVTP
jgi:hypothetical protein